MENEITEKDIKKIDEDLDVEIVEKISCPDLENKFLLIRIGNNDSPASEQDILEFSKKVDELLKPHEIKCLTLVTHHAVSVDIIR